MAEILRFTKSGSESRKRQKFARFRCTAEEKARLEARAEQAGMDVSDYMRMCCLGTEPLRAARRPPLEVTVLAQLRGELGKNGSNLNQIAAALNSRGLPVGDIPLAVTEVREVAAKIDKALGRRSA